MHSDILQEIIEATDALAVPDNAKVQFKRMVRQLGGKYGIASMARAEQLDYARRLLHARVSRPTIRDRLMALFDISRSQAYSVIQAALNCPN